MVNGFEGQQVKMKALAENGASYHIGLLSSGNQARRRRIAL